MKPLPGTHLAKLIPLFEEMLEDPALSKLTSVDKMAAMVENGYSLGTLDCYVDSVDMPKALVILTAYDCLWYEGIAVSALSVFVTKERRGNKSLVADMIGLILKYAEVKGARFIFGGERLGGISSRARQMWEKSGFTQAETTYMKVL